MRLADSRRTADEEWVVSGSGVLGDGQGGAVGEAIAAADHELFEAVLGINLIAGFCLPARLRSQRAELGAFARGAYVYFGVGADNALRRGFENLPKSIAYPRARGCGRFED